NQNLRLAATPEGSEDRKVMNVLADDELVWNSGDGRLDPFPDVRTRKLYVVNRGDQPADVTVLYTTAPPFPEMGLIVPTCISVLVFYLLYFAQRTIAPRLSAIALSTYKSEVNQPMFLIIMLIGVFSLLVFVWIPYNTLGEDIKVLKDSGFTMILVLSIIQAVWAATTSVSEEIEGRTALTVLSKPIGRPSFLTGKFLGIGWTVALMYVLLGLLLLVVVTYKPLYDAREQSDTAPSWQILFEGMAATTPGLVLAFMETMVLASLSVAISTRLPMAPNFVICFVVYVLGHLTPLIVQSSAGGFEFVHFFAQLIATVFPNLEHFNIQAAVASGVEVPGEYLLLTLGYSGIYTIIALLLGLTMFEDRDLT
ncbi:MAG: ABC transporter permease, partial [Pirellulaceae bacterium]|nr:ABC transporter permease [Pirellulaceae bacterium]